MTPDRLGEYPTAEGEKYATTAESAGRSPKQRGGRRSLQHLRFDFAQGRIRGCSGAEGPGDRRRVRRGTRISRCGTNRGFGKKPTRGTGGTHFSQCRSHPFARKRNSGGQSRLRFDRV